MSQKLTINELIKYLDTAEGSSIHKNKTETDVTAFYGVYRVSHPNFPGWSWLDAVAKQHGLNYRNSSDDRKKFNNLIEFDNKIKSTYIEYSKLFHEKSMITMHLDVFPSSKTALTYFSLATNAGEKRATKVLQAALTNIGIPTTVDGGFGPGTKRNLEQVTDAQGLNNAMLTNMQAFYDRLVARNPSKYKIYAKGWTNRLNALR